MYSRLSTYYHRDIEQYLTFAIPPGQRILVIDQHTGEDNLRVLEPKHGEIVKPSGPADSGCAFPMHESLQLDSVEGTFDYVVLCNVFGFCDDIGSFLSRLSRVCGRDTRVIVLNHRYVWTPLLRMAERLGLKRRGGLANLLSWRDTLSYMTASGFQLVSKTPSLLCPLFLFGLGPVINTLSKFVPLLDWAKVNHFSAFRLGTAWPDADASLTVCLTCRNEVNSIEPLVKAMPALTPNQEILFVEGHSTDGTREEILRVIDAYPEKNIRVIGQPGKGQGDAIRVGFSDAKGDIIILLEADMTSPPENISYVYESMRLGRSEFFEGSRFVYPLSAEAMPIMNQIGNTFFAMLFSRLFGQHITDVLSGIKAIHRWNYERLLMRWGTLGVEDPFGDFELLFGAMRLGLKGSELPIHYLPRAHGDTKTRVFFHGWMLVKMSFVAILKFRR